MDHATADLSMQLLGTALGIGPVVALAIGLAIASRRRQRAERAELALPTEPLQAPALDA